jgi:RNA polymerase sigma-70 factor (ECF subfamily)
MAMKAGDFEEWYPLLHPRVVAALTAWSRDPDAAREATDEAFARALARWDRLNGSPTLDGWVFQVALNVLRRRKRRSAVERRLLRRSWVPQPQPLPYPEVWEAVAQLPARQQMAVLLRYVGDLTEPDIAVAMEVTRGTVSSTLADARARLAALLADEPDPTEVVP